MTMYAVYGPFSHSSGAIGVSSHTKQKRYNSRGRAQTIVERLTMEGTIIGTGSTAAELQSNIRSQIAGMVSAYSVDGYSGGLMHSDGTPSAHYLSSAGSISGVRVVQPPSFGTSLGGGEYATGRSFTIGLEAEYLISDGDPLVNWQETITVIGNGGERLVMIETDNSLPLIQQVSMATPVYVEQRGQSIGSVNHIAYPGYLGGGLILDGPSEVKNSGTPRLAGSQFLDFPRSWFRRYLSIGPVGDLDPSLI